MDTLSRILGPIRQNGFVVRDIHAAMDHWIHAMGVGPWFLFEKLELDWFRHRGKRSRSVGSGAGSPTSTRAPIREA